MKKREIILKGIVALLAVVILLVCGIGIAEKYKDFWGNGKIVYVNDERLVMKDTSYEIHGKRGRKF